MSCRHPLDHIWYLRLLALLNDRLFGPVQEKQRAMEIAIEEMSERAAALDLENRQLQKALEDATRSVKVNKCSSIPVSRMSGCRRAKAHS